MKYLARVLLGWVLLLPPWTAAYPHMNKTAPFSQWHKGTPTVFTSYQTCANFKADAMKAFQNGQVKETKSAFALTPAVLHWNYLLYWNSRCEKQ